MFVNGPPGTEGPPGIQGSYPRELDGKLFVFTPIPGYDFGVPGYGLSGFAGYWVGPIDEASVEIVREHLPELFADGPHDAMWLAQKIADDMNDLAKKFIESRTREDLRTLRSMYPCPGEPCPPPSA